MTINSAPLRLGLSDPAFAPREAGQSTRNVGQWYATIGLWVLLGFAFPLVVVGDLFVGPVSTAQWLALVVCAWSGLRLANLVARGLPAWLSATFWVFVYVWFGIAPSMQLGADRFFFIEGFLGRTFTESERVTGLAVILLGLAGYEIGQKFVGVRRSDRQPTTQLSLHRLRIVTLAACAMTAFALVELGPSTLFMSRDVVNSALGISASGSKVESAFWSTVLRLPISASAFLWVQHASRLSADTHRPRWSEMSSRDRGILVASVALALVVTNPISTPRFLSGTIVSALAFAWATGRGARSCRTVLCIFMAGSILILPNADRFRSSTSPTAPLTGFTDSFLETSDYTMYSQVVTSTQYVDRFGHKPVQPMGPALFFVPRSVWTEKPIDTGDMMHDQLGYPTRLNQSSPLWAEFYMAGGFVLVFLGFLGYGAFSRFGEQTFLTFGRFGGGLLGSLLPLLAAYQVFLLRGSLLGATPRLVTLVAFAAIPFVRIKRATAQPVSVAAEPRRRGRSSHARSNKVRTARRTNLPAEG